ncbi:MAG: site-specific DNA-methyltransferase [Gammaproteobacteria bacterium]|nr:site-specific DNA-methyltransferase [Gammaproteobacteria bacterium]
MTNPQDFEKNRDEFRRQDCCTIGWCNSLEMKSDNLGKQMQSLWSIKPIARRAKRFGKHPMQKPEAWLDRIIRASSNLGDLVLDPFCGSGTTGGLWEDSVPAFNGAL